MDQKNESRRVRMTKRMMKDALLELMQHRNITNISVTSICEAADVNRSTFYKYYKDPTELLWDIERDFLDRIPAPSEIPDQKDHSALLDATSDFFDFIKDNRKMACVLFNEPYGSSFTTRLVEHLMNGYIPVNEDSVELTARFTQLYIANGTVGMMREWINADFPVSSRKIAEMMYSISRKIAY